MRSIKKYKQLLVSLTLVVASFCMIAAPASASALALPQATTTFAADCPDIKDSKTAVSELNKNENGGTCIIQRYVNPLIRFLTAVAGVAAVFSIVAAGIMYSSAAGDPSKVAAARNRISQAVIALLAFIFLLAFLNWVVPGGINGKGN